MYNIAIFLLLIFHLSASTTNFKVTKVVEGNTVGEYYGKVSYRRGVLRIKDENLVDVRSIIDINQHKNTIEINTDIAKFFVEPCECLKSSNDRLSKIYLKIQNDITEYHSDATEDGSTSKEEEWPLPGTKPVRSLEDY